jgi:arsenate reductase (thioredoxin)
MSKNRVLFLCTANSCRSQMAEAIVNSRLGDSWQAFSAGSKPSGYVHPMVVQVLDEAGIHFAGKPKSMDVFGGQDFDLVVNVCDDDENECPVWTGKGKRLHRAYPDPAKTGDLENFRKLRDAMLIEIKPLLDSVTLE